MDSYHQTNKTSRARERILRTRPVLHLVGPYVGFYRQGWHLYTLAGI